MIGHKVSFSIPPPPQRYSNIGNLSSYRIHHYHVIECIFLFLCRRERHIRMCRQIDAIAPFDGPRTSYEQPLS
jgi:hypothetical protein